VDISRGPKIQGMVERGNDLFQGTFQVLKTPIVSFPPYAPKEANRCHFPNRKAPWSSRGLPTRKQIDNPSRHNPRHPEAVEERMPQNRLSFYFSTHCIFGQLLLFLFWLLVIMIFLFFCPF